MAINREAWRREAESVGDAIERAAARAWAERKEGGRAVRYMTSRGLIMAQLERDAGQVSLVWYADSGILDRADALDLIAERMAERLS